MIEKLTKEQEDKIPEYFKRYLEKGRSTAPSNKASAENAVKELYAYFKADFHNNIIWTDSPMEAVKKVASLLADGKPVTKSHIDEAVNGAFWGQSEAYWVASHSFIAYELPVERDNLIDIVNALVDNCSGLWCLDGAVVISEKIVEIHLKGDKLHREDGPAIVFRDGSGVCVVNDQRVNSLLEASIESRLK